MSRSQQLKPKLNRQQGRATDPVGKVFHFLPIALNIHCNIYSLLIVKAVFQKAKWCENYNDKFRFTRKTAFTPQTCILLVQEDQKRGDLLTMRFGHSFLTIHNQKEDKQQIDISPEYMIRKYQRNSRGNALFYVRPSKIVSSLL